MQAFGMTAPKSKDPDKGNPLGGSWGLVSMVVNAFIVGNYSWVVVLKFWGP